MKRMLHGFLVLFSLGLTYSGAEALVAYVDAAEGLKSSVITFVLTLGFALLGPALLAVAIFFRRRGESHAAGRRSLPAIPKVFHRPYLDGYSRRVVTTAGKRRTPQWLRAMDD